MQISDEQVERFCSAFYAHWDLTANDVARGKVRDAILTAFAATPEPISVQNMRQEMSLLISLFKHAIATPGYGQDPASREEAEDHIDSAGRALEAALSLPVQPVAGSLYGEYTPISVSSSTSTPPVPPTKGPEDDLIAALEGVKVLISNARGLYAKLAYEKIDKLLALRSRPASALPVVGEDRRIAGALILLKHLENEIEMLGAKAEPVAVHNIRYWASQLRSALTPSVQP